MGLKTENYNFQEMLSTEEWALEMIPKPTLGILFLYDETPAQEEFKNEESNSLHPENIPANIFFMKQFAQNACGTIALFHMIVNAIDHTPDIVIPNSFLDKFKS